MKNLVYILSLLTLLISGCNKEEISRNVTSTSRNRIFTTSFEQNESRTFMNEKRQLSWTKDDIISIFNSNTLNSQYKFDGENGDQSGTFSFVSKAEGIGNHLTTNYAIYPYNINTEITREGVIIATLPEIEYYAVNSFGLNDNTMVAVSKDTEDTFLTFKNVGGYLKLQLYGDDVIVKSITLKGNNGEKIAGKSNITAMYDNEPIVSMQDDATTSITLNCGEKGVKIGSSAEKATAFWLVIPPITFDNGITITITDVDDNVFTQVTNKQVVIERNVIKPMATVKVKTEEPIPTLTYSTNEEELEGWSEGLFSNDGSYYMAKQAYNNGCQVTMGNLLKQENLIVYIDEDRNVREIYSDNNIFTFNNYTENSVDISFFDENGNYQTETVNRIASILSRGSVEPGQQAAAINMGLNFWSIKESLEAINENESIYKYARGWQSYALNLFNYYGNLLKLGGVSENTLFDSNVVDIIGKLDISVTAAEMGKDLYDSLKKINPNLKPGNPATFCISAWLEFYTTYLELYDEHLKAYFGNNKIEIEEITFKNNALNIDLNVLDCEHWYDIECGIIIQENSFPAPRYQDGLETKEVTNNGNYNFVENNIQKDNVYYCRPFLITKDKASLWIGFIGEMAGPLVRYGETKKYQSPMRLALEKMYKSTNGNKWTRNDNWCSDKPITEWYGVSNNENNKYFVYLGNNNLTGKIEETFPDDADITLYVDNNLLTSINVTGCNALTLLNCSNNQLTSLKASGCAEILSLWCSNNQLTSLDVSNCKSLVDFDCSKNQLSSLKISGCTVLTGLNFANNQLTSLDISGCKGLCFLNCDKNKLTFLDASECTRLKELNCILNQLTTLNVSGCTALTKLIVGGNQFTSLDVSECTALTELDCNSSYQLTSLDISKCTALTYLDCSNSPQLASLKAAGHKTLKTLYCAYNNSLTSLDVSECTALTGFNCRYSPLISLNVSGCTSLTELMTDCQLVSLNASNCKSLKSLLCTDEQLTALNVTGCTALTRLDCYINQLTSLDISECKALTQLDCSNNQLTSLNIMSCKSLEYLGCGDNQFTSLNVSGHTALTFMDCRISDKLTSINASGCTALKTLEFAHSPVNSVDISGCTSMESFYTNNSQLNSLNVSGCTALKTLYVSHQQLSSLDVSNLTSLTTLTCSSNPLRTLNVTGCTALKELNCGWCQLSSLNVSGCVALSELLCIENQMTSLNVTGCTALKKMFCYNNLLSVIDVSTCKSLTLLNCENNQVTAEIPEWFSQFEFIHDERYRYWQENVNGVSVTKHEDRGIGWWYPGEPEKGEHSPN